ncbi:NADH dehydrogenase [ubiquinone] 1 alpha subcomplex assembly factor 2 [Gouania willdenowi]|uniref:NADH dehydrogenase [ubiquinone] 1 alpha subcomplex subunit 12 n=1 Tax=Gouania willdenowi TaxID=441366 RepID=A0A8C5E1Q2_GOUWI|nr:NADH dehydrogenase [ubiquinone] 1 alpha subcomplex assembly factor 2 [Gouania willdenowi]XP_028313018.1 NADH dehydrogenase [ubiquinone] 1 alpha subcomplex assembly factor 2 [Gouania willdenowi]
MSRVAALLRRTFGVVREHVGTDHLGNKYYFIPQQKTWTGRLLRAKRTVEAATTSECEYMEGSIPIEWEAWIRGRRKEPPTIEELLKNESYREQIKVKAKEVEEREEEHQEGLKTEVKGHAAASTFGKEELNEEPSSTANTFQPGSWNPSPKK